MPIPWWRIATLALLGIALGIALANNHTWDAVIIGVLLAPGIALVGLAFYFRWKGPPRNRAEG